MSLPEFLVAGPYAAGIFMALAISVWTIWRSRRAALSLGAHHDSDRGTDDVFYLCDGQLVETNFSARRHLDQFKDETTDELRLRRFLAGHFPDIDGLLAGPFSRADMALVSHDGSYQALREVAGNEVRIVVSSRMAPEPGPRDVHSLDADAEELRLLRANTDVAPFLLWRQNPNGDVIWANRSYVNAVTELFGKERASLWPIPSLFRTLATSTPAGKNGLRRLQTPEDASGNSAWFDCQIVELGVDTLCTAFRADEAVRSEARRREFTQTLTKTFSDLAIGLAIFDRSRRLVLFNPALTELTALPVDFLTARPALLGFLDQLREKRVMPEPRDYRSWRQSISDLESASMDGTFSETWSLPDGRTYRVAGRPHPDGAMALLFEDISAEMSLTRRFRAQLEESQSVIDALDDAVAIFSAGGEMTFSNTAYRELWASNPDASVLGQSVAEATRNWHELTIPNPVWGDFRDFAFGGQEREEWSVRVTLRDGRSVSCRFVPQKAGSSLAIFRVEQGSAEATDVIRRAV